MAFLVSKKLGDWGEQLAEREYLKQGYVVVARNIYNRRGKQMGEIDLIVRTDSEIVFVEVKVRRGARYGTAVEAISRAKQLKLVRISQWFLRAFPQYQNLKPRIDLCAIQAGFSYVSCQPDEIDKTLINVIIIPHAVTTYN